MTASAIASQYFYEENKPDMFSLLIRYYLRVHVSAGLFKIC